MKRRKPLNRGKPLETRTPLRRTAPKRGPVKARSRARSEVYADLRLVVWERAGGRCERCGTGITDGFECHHRKLRSQGGRDDVTNLVALCPGPQGCHSWAHQNPAEAKAAGWIVRSGSDPANVAVVLHDGRTVRLDSLEDGAGYDVCWDTAA